MPVNASALAKPRLIKRKLSLTPSFHQTDMMGVVHNAVHLLWFEDGRLQILLEVLPLEEAIQMGVAMPVVENICHYRKPVRFGMPLQLHTTHRIEPAYQGRLVFHHFLLHEKWRCEMAWGQSVVTLVHRDTSQLIKEWPEHLWQRYLALR
jgi:acyl-CoA thioester hydrolase